jgi:beta-lactamase regulating signal transducer with metallopeptidase domain
MSSFSLTTLVSAWTFILDATIKGAVILAFVEGVIFFSRRVSAATRHALRVAGIVTVILLPLAGLMIPRSHQSIWPVKVESIAGNELALSLRFAAGAANSATAKPTGRGATEVEAATDATQPLFRMSLRKAQVAAVCWLAGIGIALLPMLFGNMRRRKILRDATMLDDPEWQNALAFARQRLGISRAVFLFKSGATSTPVTWGTVRPIVLIPTSAQDWSDERKRVVLLHELAHVKRADYFSQLVAQYACTLFWINPLVWRCAAAMRVDREEACDDLALQTGCKASDYATHLVEVAAGMRAGHIRGAIAMARPGRLEQRVIGLLDNSRSRRGPTLMARLAMMCAAAAIAVTMAAQKPAAVSETNRLREEQLEQLKKFSAQKEKQAEALAAKANEKIIPDYRALFTAAKNGEWQTVTNLYADFHRRHPQYSDKGDLPFTTYWSAVLEICLAYFDVTWGEPDHVQMAIDGFMKAIPRDAIYFGGTDPGRGIPTAFSKDHAKADPFLTLTQNALADDSYLNYLRAMYGDKIYVPTHDDSTAAFAEYAKEAGARLDAGKLKPNENVKRDGKGGIDVSGQVAVMEINARLSKVIFDKNPDREFYIEESFPLEWMYPHLSPAGQIMKLNRKPMDGLPESVVNADADFWGNRIARLLGASVTIEGSTELFAREVEKIHVTRAKKIDARYLQNDWAQRAFSKWRAGIAGIYVWRAAHAGSAAERQRMARAAEFACRQAYLLSPSSSEATFRYVNFLVEQHRYAEAQRIAQVSTRAAPTNKNFEKLVLQLDKQPR